MRANINMLNAKIKLAIAILSCSTFTYGATQHLFQVDIDQNLENSTIVAFIPVAFQF